MTTTIATHVREVMVVDDHRTFSDLLGMALDAHPRLHYAGSAVDTRSALALLDRSPVDVVVMDYRLQHDDGVAATRAIVERWPGVSVVMVTGYPTRRVMSAMAEAGGSALLPKNGPVDELIDTVIAARPGRFAVSPRLLRRLVTEAVAPRVASVTARELDVLHRLAVGHGVTTIAGELQISVHTCRDHVKSLLRKLDAHSQLEAVAIARHTGLLDSRTP